MELYRDKPRQIACRHESLNRSGCGSRRGEPTGHYFSSASVAVTHRRWLVVPLPIGRFARLVRTNHLPKRIDDKWGRLLLAST